MAGFGDVRDSLIVALDMNEREALSVARSLRGSVSWIKVGMTLFYQAGPDVVARMRELGFKVFLDLKLFDIPHQVAGAAESLGALGVDMLTVHASGGAPMVRAAVEGAARGAGTAGVTAPAVIAVTVLTSMDDEALSSVGVTEGSTVQVPRLGHIALEAGAAGVVCSPREAAAMRSLLGEQALVVTPGVRPSGADAGDQARIATPTAALRAGASHLVIGRPITTAAVPAEAARAIADEIERTT